MMDAAKWLSYHGLPCTLRAWPQIELIDNRGGKLFKAIVARLQEPAP